MISIMVLMEILFALGIVALPVVWLVLLLKKKNRKHIGKAIIICIICYIINGIAIGQLSETKEGTTEETPTPAVTAEPIKETEKAPETKTSESVPEEKEEKPVAPLGSSRSNPIVVTASQLANEINSNTDAAKTKYNGKWVQIAGKVLSAHNVAGMTSFYLHGEKGGSGLKVVCWANKEVLKPFDYKGETHTFIGQVREVSTANSTEIGNCEIIE